MFLVLQNSDNEAFGLSFEAAASRCFDLAKQTFGWPKKRKIEYLAVPASGVLVDREPCVELRNPRQAAAVLHEDQQRGGAGR